MFTYSRLRKLEEEVKYLHDRSLLNIRSNHSDLVGTVRKIESLLCHKNDYIALGDTFDIKGSTYKLISIRSGHIKDNILIENISNRDGVYALTINSELIPYHHVPKDIVVTQLKSKLYDLQ